MKANGPVQNFVKARVHWRSLYAKMSVTAAHNTDRIISFFVESLKVAKASTMISVAGDFALKHRQWKHSLKNLFFGLNIFYTVPFFVIVNFHSRMISQPFQFYL
jgi:hypothetical protein